MDNLMRGGGERMNRYRITAFKPKPNGCEQLASRRIQFCYGYFRDFVPSLPLVTFLKARSAHLGFILLPLRAQYYTASGSHRNRVSLSSDSNFVLFATGRTPARRDGSMPS